MSAHEPQAGFTQDEDDQIQILYSFHRLTFYTIQEQHFPDRSVEDVERRFYEVRDARAHLGPQAQNQELQQQREPSFGKALCHETCVSQGMLSRLLKRIISSASSRH